MYSKIMNTTNDIAHFQSDIGRIMYFTQDNKNYSEFCVGDWKTFVLRNVSGLDDDGLVTESNIPLKITPRGAELNSINQWIDSYFETKHLRLVRVHSMGDGTLIPHRDFLEFDEHANRWLRLHIPIKTNVACLHSEEKDVFHMRVGEIWHLDAVHLHSATNFSNERRLNLCLDFNIGDSPAESVFKKSVVSTKLPKPKMIERPALDEPFMTGLMGLSRIISDYNYRDIVGLLSKVHFYRKADLSQFFDWLLMISKHSGSAAVFDKSETFCRFLRAERIMHQRFTL
ncbi:hypothetical protein D5041_06990 [Verminephrobacter aporrectodeae subsp. tuberculatae]|uniref:aspartyl/asparaginyl beta-hydroxylase domain-containing protein n=1 Tax=Verminephrobacter aporrectodeae TaxID=1110389 RepID=UPI002237374B|nr:aspartyl/asparaginyl beta-hydroxylase domain-containing protein [Verminephrobacter aporrectodeae]MCW5223350.1 hypothetical protein [Verminephrobacter aporrectodeae subsp. tuberculatae]MCW5288814.1 hypothetical protein [Verminephrobacter aporrectodeae subsp. tuberculatae]